MERCNVPMDPKHPGPHLAKEAAKLLAKLTRHGIDPARLSREHRAPASSAPPSTAELRASLAELDQLLELNPPPGSAAMARLEELAGLIATYADAPPPSEQSEPRTGRQ
jgi:hypothetical protein